MSSVLPVVTLVAGGDAEAREAVIARRTAALLAGGEDCAAILEGLPSRPAHFEPAVQLVRIAPACPCCVGNLTMRVTLNRILHRPPAQLFISIIESEHRDALRQFLLAPPYDKRLTLSDDLIV